MAYLGTEVLAPAKTIAAGTTEIVVDFRAQVVSIAPAAGSTLTEINSCELMLVIDETGRTVPTGEKLGSTRPSFEVVSIGTYILKRIAVTTEDVGGYVKDGLQAAR